MTAPSVLVDPVQKGLSLERVRDLLAGSMALGEGISAITLAGRSAGEIERAVKQALVRTCQCQSLSP